MGRFEFCTKDLAIFGKPYMEIPRFELTDIATMIEPKNNSLMFITAKKWKNEFEQKLKKVKNCLFLVQNGVEFTDKEIERNNTVVHVENARLEFAKILKFILDENRKEDQYRILDNGAVVGVTAHIGENVLIEPQVFIDNYVTIGNNVQILTGVKIRKYVEIDDGVIIRENSVIGAQGLGVETDKDGRKYRIPHIGGVKIGKNVEIGALTSVVAGTVEPTILEENVMVDDLNHIAHNCFLGRGTVTTGCVEMSGSARVGENGYIAPNSTLRNGIELGENCFVGQASSVTKNIEGNITIAGNPAEELSVMRTMRKIQKRQLEDYREELRQREGTV